MSTEEKRRGNILYVDDEQGNLLAFVASFRKFYENIYTVTSAKEGIEMIRKHPIDVVLTDQRMPDMTGVQFLEAISPEFPNILRLVVTGFTDIDAVIDAINTGKIFRFIKKPWNKDELKHYIDQALSIRELELSNRKLVEGLKKEATENERLVSIYKQYVPEDIIKEMHPIEQPPSMVSQESRAVEEDKKYHFFIIDDDNRTIELYARLLKEKGHKISSSTSGKEGLREIFEVQPDCVLCDLTMPDLDGVDLLNCIRLKQDIKQPKFIIITGKIFDFDRRRAFQNGVDGYITKPIRSESFVKEIIDILDTSMVVGFYGVRGTLPVPGPKTLRYGGNTNCVTLRIANKHFLIFDAGTGIKALSDLLIAENNFPLRAKIFITHPHYDHINGIPFFVPLYMKGNHFDIYGTRHGELGIETLLNNQMENVYFPVTMKEFMADKNFHDLTEETFQIEDLRIQTIFLNHPGRCIAYRIDFQKKSFCYVTDNELYLENSPHFLQHDVDRLIDFIKDADLALIDTTYSDEEYPKKVGWGHSCVSRVIDVADKAHVKLLALYHHDLYQYDDDIDQKLKLAQALLEKRNSKTKCIAPAEGSSIIL